MFDLRHPLSRTVFALALVLLALFIFFPVYWLVITSFKPSGDLFQRVPDLIPSRLTLEHYRTAFGDANLPRYIRNSLITAGGSSFLTTMLATYAAFSFAKYRYAGRKPMLYVMLSAQMFPFAVLLITIYPLFTALGLRDSYLGLILAYIVFGLPAGTYMLYSYFMQLPNELIEAARIDGASDLRIIHTIVLPLSLPGLVTVGLYAFMWAWNDLLYSLTLLSSSDLRTIGPGLLLNYLGELSNDWGGAMAASLLCSLPVIIAFGFLQRYFIQGITAGAVKS